MDELKLTFLGQAGTILQYKDTTLVTDPHLSDFLSKGPNSPWIRSYPAPTTLEKIQPDGIVISHAHGDHLDPLTLKPYYETGAKAPIYVPAPIAERAANFCGDAVKEARAEETFTLGDMTITPIPCAHTELHQNEAGDYCELSYLIDCGAIRVLFGGDLSIYDGLVERLKKENPDIVILPVNGTDEERTKAHIIGNINEVEAAEIAHECDAVLFPMHHDLYVINGCSEERIIAAANDKGARLMLLRAMQTSVYTK